MKKLAIAAVAVVVVLGIILGIQVGRNNKLQADLKDLETAQAELQTVKENLEEVQAKLDAVTEEKTAQDAQLEEARKGVEDALEQVTALTEENAGLLTTMGAGKEDTEKLQADKASLEEQVAALTKSGEEAASQLETARGEAEALKTQVASLEEQVATLTKSGEDAAAKLETAQSEAEELKSQTATLEEQVAALTKDGEDTAAQLETARGEAEVLKPQVEALEGKVTSLEEEVAQGKTSAEEEAKRYADLESEYQKLVAKNQELTDAVANAEAELQAAAASLSVTVQEQPVAEERAPVSIDVFHTNDVHSRVEGNDKDLIGYAKLATLVKQAREQGPTLLLDAGDVLHGMSFSTALEGESVVKLMNLVGYDAMTPGNHDFNYGYARLQELAGMMDFSSINSNILLEDGNTAFTPYVIKEVGGKRIALVGVANPQMQSAIHPDRIKGLKFEGEDLAAQTVQQVLEEKPDAVIVLAHWGADDAYQPNSSVLAKIPGVNLVIDGHSHTHYADIQQVEDGAVIVSAYEYLKTLGHLVMHFDAQNNVTIEVSPIFYADTEQVEPDEEVQAYIEKTKQEIEAVTSEVVGSTKVKLEGAREVVRTQETNLGNLAADALRLSTEADFALTNGGGIRTSVEVGDITKGNLIEVFPFGNSVVLIEVRGAQLLEAMEHGLRLYPEQNGGFPQISGGKLVFNPAKPAGERVVSLEVDGKPVDPNSTYLVATNDFMAAGGDDYLMFKESPVLLYGGTLDEALIEHIQELGEVDLEVEGRIVALEAEQEAPAEEPVETETKDEGKAA